VNYCLVRVLGHLWSALAIGWMDRRCFAGWYRVVGNACRFNAPIPAAACRPRSGDVVGAICGNTGRRDGAGHLLQRWAAFSPWYAALISNKDLRESPVARLPGFGTVIHAG